MKRGFFLGALTASLIWVVVLSMPFMVPQQLSRTMFSLLDVSVPPSRADYIFVPSGSLYYRMPFAIGLMNRHLADTMVLTVTEPSRWRREVRNITDADVTEGSLVLRLLRTHGVDESQVIFLGESRSTWQDARLFSEFMGKHPGATAMVVSDGYHMRRLRLSFGRTNEQVAARITCVSSSNFDDLLSRDTEYSDVYQLIFKEWFKLVFYVLGRA